MSDDTDFVSMYEELGLEADCGMTAFKQAYRRRVAALHPDMQGTDSDLPRLQRLNRMYEAALEFHRAHGRLPGAPAVAARPRVQHAAPAPCAEDDVLAPRPTRRRYLLAGAMVAAVLYWLGANRTSIPTLDPSGPGDSAATAWQPRAPRRLELGMDAEQARRVLGEPTVEHLGRWQYGPSWVDFECGRVAGWYSAPARPLNVSRDSAQLDGPRGPAACS